MEAKFDSTNNEQRSAYRMIERTNNSFFLAGRAGTGKTTFLKNVTCRGVSRKSSSSWHLPDRLPSTLEDRPSIRSSGLTSGSWGPER